MIEQLQNKFIIIYSKDRKQYLVEFAYNERHRVLDDIWTKNKEEASLFNVNELEFIEEVYEYEDLVVELKK